MPSSKLPFISARMKQKTDISPAFDIECWVVIISNPVWDMSIKNTNGPVNCLVMPENTLEDRQAEKTFPTYEDAYKFVREWFLCN